MFTGIIEDVGKIEKISINTLKITTCLGQINEGDSVAVNGICLTVTRSGKGTIEFDFSPETVSRTSISGLSTRAHVNLERALKMGDRLGGHMVSGHVEAVGKTLAITTAGNSFIYRFSLPRQLEKYVVAKGSIAVDGISLTVAETGSGYFTAAVIPHTVSATNLQYKKTGDSVNLETDIMARHVEKILNKGGSQSITEELLKENGYL